MRYIYQGVAKDGNGKIIPSATVSVYLAGTTTAADVYAASTGGAAVNSVTCGTDGHFLFWVDDTEYSLVARFKIVISKANFISKTFDNLQIVPNDVDGDNYYPVYSATDQGVTGDNNTLKYYIDLLAGNYGTIVLRHNSGTNATVYTLTTSETIPSNITLKIERGAAIYGAGTLTVNCTLDAGPYIIFGSTLTVEGITQTVYPEWFGAVGDGATNDTSALQKAINAGTKIVFNNSYAITSELTATGDIDLDGRGNEILYAHDHVALNVTPTLNSPVAISAISTVTLAYSTKVSRITAAGHGVNIGDIVLVFSSDAITADNTGMIGELVYIKKTDGDYIYADKILRSTYSTSPKIIKLNDAKVNIRNLTFRGNGDITATVGSRGRAALQVVGCINPQINVSVKNGWSRGVFLISCWNPNVIAYTNHLRNDTSDSAYGYGVAATCATKGGTVTVYATDNTHAFTTNVYSVINDMWHGEPDGVHVSGSAISCSAHAWDTHAGSYDIEFKNITANHVSAPATGGSAGTQYGMQLRGVGAKVFGFHAINVKSLIYIDLSATHDSEGITIIQGVQAYVTDNYKTASGDNSGFLTVGSNLSAAADHEIILKDCFLRNYTLTLVDAMCKISIFDSVFLESNFIRLGSNNTVHLRNIYRVQIGESITANAGTTVYADNIHVKFVSGTGTIFQSLNATAAFYTSNCYSSCGTKNLLTGSAVMKNIQAPAEAVAIPDGTTSLDISTNVGFYETANTAPTTLGFSGGKEGDSFTIFFEDANTTITNGYPIRLSGHVDVTPTAHSSIAFRRINSNYKETSRMIY